MQMGTKKIAPPKGWEKEKKSPKIHTGARGRERRALEKVVGALVVFEKKEKGGNEHAGDDSRD